MYKTMKTVIESGTYELAAMVERLKKLDARGDIEPEERDELIALAREKADPLYETDKGGMLAAHERRIRALEESVQALMGGAKDEEEAVDEYQPGRWYYAGDKATCEGKTYECTAPEGVACVWSPTDYPAYWKLV